MVELNIEMFADRVNKLTGIQTENEKAGIKYLYDTVFSALLQGKDIYIGDIDFSRFTFDEYQEFYNEISCRTQAAEKLYSVMNRAKPCSISADKVFF